MNCNLNFHLSFVQYFLFNLRPLFTVFPLYFPVFGSASGSEFFGAYPDPRGKKSRSLTLEKTDQFLFLSFQPFGSDLTQREVVRTIQH